VCQAARFQLVLHNEKYTEYQKVALHVSKALKVKCSNKMLFHRTEHAKIIAYPYKIARNGTFLRIKYIIIPLLKEYYK